MVANKKWVSGALRSILLLMTVPAFTNPALAKILKCSWDTYIYVDGADVEIHRENFDFIDTSIKSRIPQLEITAKLIGQLAGDAREFCACNGIFDISYAISPFNDNFGDIRSEVKIKAHRIKSSTVNDEKWAKEMEQICTNFQRELAQKNPFPYTSTIPGVETNPANYTFKKLLDTFAPSYTCQNPFDYVAEAKDYFGDYWDLSRMEKWMISEENVPDFCETACNSFDHEFFNLCKVSDFP